MWRCLGTYSGPKSFRAFTQFVKAQVYLYNEHKSFQVYVTDSLWLMAEGKRYTTRWEDIITPPKKQESAEHVINRVISSAGLEVIEDEFAGPSSKNNV